MVKACGACVLGSYLIFVIIFNLSCCVTAEFKGNLPHVGSASIIKLREKRKTPTDLKNNYLSVTQNVSDSKTLPPQPTTSQNLLNASIGGATQHNETVSSMVVPYSASDRPLLGVNGTGQLKDTTINNSTINNSTKTVVSDPIQTIINDSSKYPKRVLTSASIGASAATASVAGAVTAPPETLEEKVVDNKNVPEDETLTALKNRNYTADQSDYHNYYNSSMYVDKVQADDMWKAIKNITDNVMLSYTHRRALTEELSFDFPFYGYPVRKITVATGGFLYTGEYVHSWLAATQYIAPLMANFEISLTTDSFVGLNDNGTAFTVIWENVSLQDKPDVGKFTFSTTLHKNGDIVFTYFNIPILDHTIQDDKHRFKVGLSDAYIIDKIVDFDRRKTIYEYHRINFASSDITNSTIIYLKALPTCLSKNDCASCVNHNTTFDCAWCQILNRCSSGTDRRKQEWLHKGCDRTQISNITVCPALGERGNNADQYKTSTAQSTNSNPSNSNQNTVSPHQLQPSEDGTSTVTDLKNNHLSVTQNVSDSKTLPPQPTTPQNLLNASIGGATQHNETVSSMAVPYSASDRPLLGVNGTGQLKDMTINNSTINNSTKTVVSDPIQTIINDSSKYPKRVLTSASIGASAATASVAGAVTAPPETLEEKVVDNKNVPEDETLTALKNRNYTADQSDYHNYYNSSMYVDKLQADEMWKAIKNITHNVMLSYAHRRALTEELSFDFPFYGYPVRKITVATGGFLYTGEYVHSWLAATQYIAPLMANFDISLTTDSFVGLNDNGTAFTVIWENVSLQDKPDVGKFTFSTTLHKNGDIVFTYFNIPILDHTIQDDKHRFKVGLSDAYIIDKIVDFDRRKTIYEYHRINFASSDITNSTIIYLKALPTCLSKNDCASCVNHNTTFDCAWCPILNRCSSGTDRRKQEWLHKGCDRTQISNITVCPALGERGNNADQYKTSTAQSTNSNPSNSNQNTVSPHQLQPSEDGTSTVTATNSQPLNKASMDGIDV